MDDLKDTFNEDQLRFSSATEERQKTPEKSATMIFQATTKRFLQKQRKAEIHHWEHK